MRLAVVSCLLSMLLGCSASSALTDISNVCSIFDDQRGWYRAAVRSQREWGIPIPTLMAVIYKESSFQRNARPPRNRILGILPGGRKSSAFGYPQAKDETWNDYVEATGNKWAKRNNFSDSVDFVGWYLKRAVDHAGVSRDDAKGLYLSYHEGLSGYESGNWRNNEWLKATATTVDKQAKRYTNQLPKCRASRRFR